jgi:hypothetical protein
MTDEICVRSYFACNWRFDTLHVVEHDKLCSLFLVARLEMALLELSIILKYSIERAD